MISSNGTHISTYLHICTYMCGYVNAFNVIMHLYFLISALKCSKKLLNKHKYEYFVNCIFRLNTFWLSQRIRECSLWRMWNQLSCWPIAYICASMNCFHKSHMKSHKSIYSYAGPHVCFYICMNTHILYTLRI